MLFVDTAPVGLDTFSVGLYLPSRGMRMFQCPQWVGTWQAEESWGWVHGVRRAACMQWPRVCVGSDSTVARCEIQGLTGGVFCCREQRVLRVLFWLRRSLGIPIDGFFSPLHATLQTRLAGYMSLTHKGHQDAPIQRHESACHNTNARA